ncbi:MAG: YciI family protein [Phycisphaerales bacterium]
MNQYICSLTPARPDMPENPTEEESALVASHFAYYTSLKDAGTLILAGRTMQKPYAGTLIFKAENDEQAASIVHQDPAVEQGVFTARIEPFSVALMNAPD